MARILMLGWEFPPVYNGGLGIATYGIVKALSKHHRIRLIVPHIEEGSLLSGVDMVGLNKVSAKEAHLDQLNISFPNTEVSRIPVGLSPYHFVNEALNRRTSKDAFQALRRGVKDITLIHEIFGLGDAYHAVMQKVHLFAALAETIALDQRFDVIHAHDWVTYAAGIRIKQRSDKPLVVHVHALETDRAGEQARNDIYHLEKEAMTIADRIIAVSQYTKDQIVQWYHIDPAKIIVIHNGIDRMMVERKTHALRDKYVTFLGRLTHQKGPQFLLETAAKVARVYPRVKFLVAGTGDQFTHLLETAAYHKLGRKFIFTGFLSRARVNELLSTSDVYFMPSISEPFGLTALEATMHEVPTVISKQSGAAEVLPSSLKADFWDTDKFANYIHALLRYPALSNALTNEATKDLNGLTWDDAASRITKLYKELSQ